MLAFYKLKLIVNEFGIICLSDDVQPHVLFLQLFVLGLVHVAFSEIDVIDCVLDGRKHLLAFHVSLPVFAVQTTQKHFVKSIKYLVLSVISSLFVNGLNVLFVYRSGFVLNAFVNLQVLLRILGL